jgi:hypothetical protein
VCSHRCVHVRRYGVADCLCSHLGRKAGWPQGSPTPDTYVAVIASGYAGVHGKLCATCTWQHTSRQP